VIDLSPLGRNPMPWDGGRLRITYNGEVYNYRELRAELERDGCRFRSQTDTEVILAAYDRWGIECLQRFIGMFAFAIWDEPRRRLFLARDRLGKKPFYYAERDGGFAFASELKALAAAPSFPRELDRRRGAAVPPLWLRARAALDLQGGAQAAAGLLRRVRGGTAGAGAVLGPGGGRALRAVSMSDAEVDAHLEALLTDAVARRMIADVPVGAFLSGGIDSSLVVALMQEVGSTRRAPSRSSSTTPSTTNRRTRPPSRGTSGPSTTRRPAASARCWTSSSGSPTSTTSRSPTRRPSRRTWCRRSRAARVTVALSGDGGDELFFGYPRYFFHDRARRLLDAPAPVRRALAGLAAVAPWRRVRRAADVLREESGDHYVRFIAWWSEHDVARMAGPVPPHPAYSAALARLAALPVSARAPVLDVVSYLPDDILTKVDRASMGVSLETRCPLLDHRVAEFALRLPLHQRANRRRGKLPLRRLLEKRVPRALIDRPKMGFGVPLADWLRGPLRTRMDAYVLGGKSLSLPGLDAGPAREVCGTSSSQGRNHRTDCCGTSSRWQLGRGVAPEPVRQAVAS
jgi:asparagine synthase (glutamine-hydrolysing)